MSNSLLNVNSALHNMSSGGKSSGGGFSLSGGAAKGIGAGLAGAGSLYSMYSDVKDIYNQNPEGMVQQDYYSPYSPPPAFQAQDNPFQKGVGAKMTFDGLSKGAAIGTAIAPGIGTAIGAGVGGVAGGIAGLFGGGRNKKNRGKFDTAQEEARQDWLSANNAYSEEMGNQAMNLAKQRNLAQRGAGSIPSYGSTIYGF
jgi:hypothetical protein